MVCFSCLPGPFPKNHIVPTTEGVGWNWRVGTSGEHTNVDGWETQPENHLGFMKPCVNSGRYLPYQKVQEFFPSTVMSNEDHMGKTMMNDIPDMLDETLMTLETCCHTCNMYRHVLLERSYISKLNDESSSFELQEFSIKLAEAFLGCKIA